jgi:hypothetical protein
MTVSPAAHGSPMSAAQLTPFPIKRLDERHGKEYDNWVLSDLLVETPKVLPIWLRCCRLTTAWTARLRPLLVGNLTLWGLLTTGGS